jgi:hypothetical protein
MGTLENTIYVSLRIGSIDWIVKEQGTVEDVNIAAASARVDDVDISELRRSGSCLFNAADEI